MPANTYLEEAAKRVRESVAALRDEIRKIQSDAYHAEIHLHNDESHDVNEVATLKMEAIVTPDPAHKSALLLHVKQLESDERNKKDEARRIDIDSARRVQTITDVLSSLESMASQLDAKAAMVRRIL
jgi:hypothetical protein